MYTLLYLKWRANKDLLYSTWRLFNVTWQPHRRGVWERMGTCLCITESLCYSPETVTTLFINQLYPNPKLKVKENRFIDVLQKLTYFHCYLILLCLNISQYNYIFLLMDISIISNFAVIKMSL